MVRIWSRRETGENKRQTAAISDLVRACESLVAALAEQNAASNRRKQEAGDGESVQDIAQTQQDANSRSSQEGAVQNSPITRLLGHGGDVLAGLTLLGLACYATTWFAYSRFYGDLGIRPAEIGITYAYIVPRAAVGLTLLVIAAVAVILPVVLSANLDPPQSSSWSATVLISLGPIVFATWLFDRYEGDVSDAVGLSFLWLGIIIGFANLGPLLFMVREHQRRIPIVAPLLLLVSGIGVVILEWLVRAHGQSTFAKGSLILLEVILAIVGINAIAGLVQRLVRGARSSRQRKKTGTKTSAQQKNVPRWRRFKWVTAAVEWLTAQVHESRRMENWVHAALVVFCVSLLLFAFIKGATASGAKAAERIKEGRPAFGEDSLIDSILDLNVPKVQVKWIGDAPSKELPPTAVFIGSSNGVVTLYSPSSCQAIRAPTGTVIMKQIEPDSDVGSCSA